MQRSIAAAVAMLAFATLADAKPASTTKYTYFPIKGANAEQVYKAILRKGPRVGGEKAYAMTTALTTPQGKLVQAGGSCRIEGYRLKIDFEIKLPKIGNEKALPKTDRGRWRQFASFLKVHEETHRAIWLGCAADLERKVSAIRSKTCIEAGEKADRLWKAARAACARKHDAFDQAEQKKVLQHPFVKLVYGRTVKTTHAAKVK